MTSFGTSSSLILGITFVSVFTFFADDLNDWYHRRLAVEHPKTDSATRYAEAPQPLNRLPNETNAKDPAWASNVATEGHASAASGQNSAAKPISRSDLPTSPAERPLDVSRVGKVDPQIDRDAADVAGQASAVQDQVASPDHKIARSDRDTNASGEVHGSVAHVPGDKLAIGLMA